MSQNTVSKASALKTDWKIQAFNLHDGFTDFILSRQAMLCTTATIKNYRWVLGKFIMFLEGQGVTAPSEVSARLVRQFLSQYAGKSDWYVNGYARAIRTLLRFWHAEGYMPELVKFDMPRVGSKRLPYLTADEVKKVLGVCDLREKTIILLMVDTGLRRQEVCNLNRQDVDIETGTINVHQGKGKKDRLVIIGAVTRRALFAYLKVTLDQANTAPLIQTVKGDRFTQSGLRSFFLRLSRRCDIHISPHMLRRTFATLSLKAGMDVVHLQALMGHHNLETTRRYIQLLDEDLINEHHEHSPIDNLKRLR